MTTLFTPAAGVEEIPAYGLHRPTVGDAIQALTRVLGAEAPQRCEDLLQAARVDGTETDRESMRRLLDVMAGAETEIVVIALSLRIRVASFERLTAATQLPGSAS